MSDDDLMERIAKHQEAFDKGTGFVVGPIVVWSEDGQLRINRIDSNDVIKARQQRLFDILSIVTSAESEAHLVNAWARNHTGATGQRELKRLLDTLAQARIMLGKEYDRGA